MGITTKENIRKICKINNLCLVVLEGFNYLGYFRKLSIVNYIIYIFILEFLNFIYLLDLIYVYVYKNSFCKQILKVIYFYCHIRRTCKFFYG